MLKSALDYFGNPNLTQTSDSSPSSSTDDPMIGSNVDVGGIKILVKRRIGEGGFAFVYEAVDAETRSRSYALKRLLAVDKEKRAAIVQEISILKTLSSHNRIVSFVTSANGNRQVSPGRSIEEFLVLMEYCPTVLSDVLQARSTSYPPDAVARIFTQVMDAVSVLHSSNPPIVHRDLKLENLLINSKRNGIKLCDFGSATTETFHPNMNWTMNQRTTLEEETAKHTTPMYRAPEMLDTWSNYSVDTKADIWACGCLLFVLCFHHHPFEDSAKLAIVNGNYRIPPNDTKYTMFHDLIRQMLTVDPSLRPDSNQVLQHLTGVSLSNGIDPTLDIDFEIAPSNSPTVENIPNLRTPTASFYDHSSPSKQPQQTSPQALQSSQAGSAGLMSSIKGGAGSFMKNIRDKSHSVIQTVQHSMATKELDMHCITERIAAMSYPADGLESAFKNHIDDISATIESKHSNKYMIVNLSEKRYNGPLKFPTGQVVNAGWRTSTVTPLVLVLETVKNCLHFLRKDANHILVIHCLDGRSNTAVLVCGLLMACKFVPNFKDALKFFALKRCEALLDNYHITMLKYLESIYTSPSSFVESRAITITSIILEPVPLFTKSQDGCRPYVEVTKGNGETANIPSNISDYNAIKSFTGYDEEAIVKANVGVEGDVVLSFFHARQTLGSFLSSNKFEGLLIAKLYFHTGFLNANTSCIKVKLKDLDGITSDSAGVRDQRFPSNFKIVINFRPEKDIKKIDIVKSPSNSLGLIFASQAEHESNHSMMELCEKSASNGGKESPLEENGSIPKAPPRLKPNSSFDKSSRSATPNSMKSASQESGLKIEDLISPVVDLPPESTVEDKRSEKIDKGIQPLVETDLFKTSNPLASKGNANVENFTSTSQTNNIREGNNALLLDLGFGPSTKNNNEITSDYVNNGESGQNRSTLNKPSDVDTLLDISVGTSSHQTSDPQKMVSSDIDLFSSDFTSPNVNLLDNVGSNMQSSNSGADLFSLTENPSSGTKTSSNLLGDFGDFAAPSIANSTKQNKNIPSPMNPTSKQTSTADELVDNLLSGLDMNRQHSSKTQVPTVGPNYNSSFFADKPKKPTIVPQMSSKKVASDTFNDLLGGFTATSSNVNENKTIGEMKKKEEMKQMTPTEAKVFAWKDGKSRNLRALLCSLDKILWDGAKWQQCGMHQLVSENDVNKMYKKAVLAVHPDRQRGTENEELATALQKELNDAWSEHKKDLS